MIINVYVPAHFFYQQVIRMHLQGGFAVISLYSVVLGYSLLSLRIRSRKRNRKSRLVTMTKAES